MEGCEIVLFGWVCVVCSDLVFMLYYVLSGDDVVCLSYLVEIELIDIDVVMLV